MLFHVKLPLAFAASRFSLPAWPASRAKRA